MTVKKLQLSSLGKGMPALTQVCGLMLAESAAVCLEDQAHQSGVNLQLDGIQSNSFQLEWASVDDQQRSCYNDLQEATERGASGVAILLVQEITGKVVVERSKKGTGFDYWLGDDDDDMLFAGKARLEVSGILSGVEKIPGRMRQKKGQIKASDHLAPGYVAVVEFGEPTARVEVK